MFLGQILYFDGLTMKRTTMKIWFKYKYRGSKLRPPYLRDSDVDFKNKPAAQAAGQTLPDATPPVYKTDHSAKLPYILNQYSNLDTLQDLESLKKCQYFF